MGSRQMPLHGPLEHKGNRHKGRNASNDKAVLVAGQDEVHSHQYPGPKNEKFHQ